MNSLTDHNCLNARCGQQRILKLHDGGGLYLWVYQDGRKYWRMRYRLGGKEKSLPPRPLMDMNSVHPGCLRNDRQAE